MSPRIKPKEFEVLLRESFREEADGAGVLLHGPDAHVQRRGRDAILDSDDAEIIVYELFGDRA